MEDLKVPLAEHFHSIQGEGAYTGLPMHFMRFPGCTVGRTRASVYGQSTSPEQPYFPVLQTGAEAKVCTAFTGQEFWCDTDYEKHEEAPVSQLLNETFETAVCFTGGEPLMHQQKPWFKLLLTETKAAVHVETSGTIVPLFEFDWLTVSPKHGWLPEAVAKADQVKFLITADTKLEKLFEVLEHASPGVLVYLSPVFDPNQLVQANLERCFEILKTRPDWMLGCQWHKFLGLR